MEHGDYKTFKTAKNANPYAKDMHGYYFWEELIKEEMDDSVVKDALNKLNLKLKRK